MRKVIFGLLFFIGFSKVSFAQVVENRAEIHRNKVFPIVPLLDERLKEDTERILKRLDKNIRRIDCGPYMIGISRGGLKPEEIVFIFSGWFGPAHRDSGEVISEVVVAKSKEISVLIEKDSEFPEGRFISSKPFLVELWMTAKEYERAKKCLPIPKGSNRSA